MTEGLNPQEPTRHALPPGLMHDLRTPLNQIIGYSELMAEQAREGGQVTFVRDLERVQAAGHRIAGIIDQNFTAYAAPEEVTVQHVDKADSQASERTSGEGESGLILVVDDDEGNRDVLSKRLRRDGYAVAMAESGRQALEMLSSDSYDMVLLDIMMPEMDGYEVLRQIMANKHWEHIPVIMISALGELDTVAKCIEMGADDYLQKPFNPILLKARIASSLHKKHARDREVLHFHQLELSYQRLQELEQLRDDLTHMIVHDLRTPLTSVTASMQTLEAVGDVNEAQREIIAIALDGAGQLLTSINTLLDVEKLESGSMELDLTLLSLPEVIGEALANVSPLATAKGLSLTKEIADDLPWLQADEDKVQRILVNLLGNAIKFTPSGGTVSLLAHPTKDGRSVEFCIQDTGEGIPPESFERIFEKFGQVGSRQGGRKMSTGLGLTFCKLAVEAHGGEIKVESTPGQGATFYFTMPLERTALASTM